MATIQGGAGDDGIAPAGDDRAEGRGSQANIADYADAAGGVTVNLAAGLAQGPSGTDTPMDMVAARGSAFADTIAGSAAADLLDGGAGVDLMARHGPGRDGGLRGRPRQLPLQPGRRSRHHPGQRRRPAGDRLRRDERRHRVRGRHPLHLPRLRRDRGGDRAHRDHRRRPVRLAHDRCTARHRRARCRCRRRPEPGTTRRRHRDASLWRVDPRRGCGDRPWHRRGDRPRRREDHRGGRRDLRWRHAHHRQRPSLG